MTISGKIPRAAVVTGGGQRLGRAAAMELARLGFDVAVHCRGNREAAEATAADIRALGRRAMVVRADLAVEAEVAGVIGENDTMDAKTLPAVRMPNREGFVRFSRGR